MGNPKFQQSYINPVGLFSFGSQGCELLSSLARIINDSISLCCRLHAVQRGNERVKTDSGCAVQYLFFFRPTWRLKNKQLGKKYLDNHC